MDIVGHGIDIIETARIKKLMEKPENYFEMRCFTEVERYIPESNVNRIQYFAGRFAAKEAVLKVLGTGWSQGISWTDIEIRRLPSGAPSVFLSDKCEEIATDLGISKWLLSISHTTSYVVASAIAVRSNVC